MVVCLLTALLNNSCLGKELHCFSWYENSGLKKGFYCVLMIKGNPVCSLIFLNVNHVACFVLMQRSYWTCGLLFIDPMLFENCDNFFVICRQCSECDKESSGSDFEVVDTEAPRRLRHNKEAEKLLTPLTPRVSNSDINQGGMKIFTVFTLIFHQPGIRGFKSPATVALVTRF
jgi:hypothetical protein